MGIWGTLGGVAGGVGGFVVGGPAGAALGYAGGSALGGAVDKYNESGNGPGGVRMGGPRYDGRYGQGAQKEADRASELGAAGAARTRQLGQQLGAEAAYGQAKSINNMDTGNYRSNQLYGNAAGMYGAAEGNAADAAGARGNAMAGIDRLRSFYEQGPGPSAAQAQLRAGQDSANRNALALAHTGGGGANSMRAAMRAGAAGNQQANQAAAGLRANEAANWRQTQLGAMGQEQNALAGVRAGDASMMGQRYGAAGQQLGAAGAAGQTALGYGNLGLGYGGQQNQARMGAEGMAIGQEQGGEQARGGILSQQLGADTSRYGADRGVAVGMANVAQRDRAADMAMTGTLIGAGVNMMSDIRAKENIRPVSAASLVGRLDALEAGGAPAPDETTRLRPEQEQAFQQWAKQNGIRDVDHPDSHYDYRGAFLSGLKAGPDAHWPDTYKQHGHPTFSVESQYSRGQNDGGHWDGDKYVPAASPATDLRRTGSYAYDYRDPAANGEGSQVGPMAQELEHSAAAGAVSTGPDGMKRVDPNRLTMTNTAAIGEQQRRLDAIEAMVADKSGGNFEPQGAATNGQRVIRKTEAVEGRRMGDDEKRAMATFGHIGSIKPEDEAFIRASSAPKQRASASAGPARRIRGERY